MKDFEGMGERKRRCNSTVVSNKVVNIEEVWHQEDQAHTIRGWCESNIDTVGASMVGCMTPGKRRKQSQKQMPRGFAGAEPLKQKLMMMSFSLSLS